MQNLIAIYGSPRKGGNTDILLDRFLDFIPGNVEVNKIFLRELNFIGCDECRGCMNSGICVKKDDLGGVFSLILDSKYVVISIPVYFLGPPSLTKAFIDRAQHLWVKRFLLKSLKPNSGSPVGCLLSCGGFHGSNRIFNCNISIVKAFYNACAVKYIGELVFSGIESRGDILNIEELNSILTDFAHRFFGCIYKNE